MAKEVLALGVETLAELQQRLYADDHWSVLLMLQAMDAAGKDGAIKHVMSGARSRLPLALHETTAWSRTDRDFQSILL